MKKQFLGKATLTVAAAAATVFVGDKVVNADTYTLQYGDSFYSVAQMYVSAQ